MGNPVSHMSKKMERRTKRKKKISLGIDAENIFFTTVVQPGDPIAEAEIYDSIAFRRFLGINDLGEGIPDETTILRFRRFLEEHKLQEKFFQKTKKILETQDHLLKEGTIVDATIIKASSSTKNKAKTRDPEMSSTKKKMREEGKTYLITDKTYRRRKHKDITEEAWEKLKKIPTKLSSKQQKRNQKIASIRSKVEHPFRIIKHLWGHSKVRYRGIEKNALQWNTLAMLSNFYMLSHNCCFLKS